MVNAANVASAEFAGRKLRGAADVLQQVPNRSFPAIAASLLVAGGMLVLAGWIFDVKIFQSLTSSWVTMKANAALAFVFCGISLHCLSDTRGSARRRLAGLASAVAVLVIGLLTVVQFAWNADLGIDELLLQQASTAVDTARPGRMAAATAAGLALLGSALLFQASAFSRSRRLSMVLALLVMAIAAIAVSGYAFGVEVFYSVQPAFSMALHTAFLLGLGSLGILATRPETAAAARAAASAAAESALHGQVLFEQSRDGIVILDEEHKLHEANAGFRSLLGCTSVELDGKKPWDWDLDSPTREEWLRNWAEPLATGGEIRTRFRAGKGENVDVAVSCTPARVRGRRLLYLVCRDVTARQAADRSLHAAEQRFRRALSNIPEVVVVYDRQLRICYINNAARAVTGMKASEFIGKRDEEIFPPEVHATYLPTLRNALEDKLIRKVEGDVTLPRVGRRTVHITCVPLLDRRGHVREVLTITRDLTLQNAAESALKASEGRYRDLIEQVSDGVFICDAKGEFTVVNSHCCRLLGYSRDELLGMNGTEIWTREDTGDTSRRIAVLSPGQDLRYERRLKRKDGSSFRADISVKMLGSGGMQIMFKEAGRTIRATE